MAVVGGGGNNPPLGQVTMEMEESLDEVILGQSIIIRLSGAVNPSATYGLKAVLSTGQEINVGNFDGNGEIIYTPEITGIITLVGTHIHNTIVITVNKPIKKHENYMYFTKLNNRIFDLYKNDRELENFTYSIDEIKNNNLFDVINLYNENSNIDVTLDDFYTFIDDTNNINYKIDLGDDVLYVDSPTSWYGTHIFTKNDFILEYTINTNLNKINNFKVGVGKVTIERSSNDEWYFCIDGQKIIDFIVNKEKDIKIKFYSHYDDLNDKQILEVFVDGKKRQSYMSSEHECKLIFEKTIGGELIITDFNLNILTTTPIQMNKIIPLFRPMEIISDYDNIKILDNKCIIALDRLLPTYIDFYNNENDDMIMTLDNSDEIVPIYQMGETLTFSDINNYVYLLRKYITINNFLTIKEGLYDGEFANYEFILENLSIVDNAILITDETLEGNLSILTTDLIIPESDYYIEFLILNINDTNVSNFERNDDVFKQQILRVKLEKDNLTNINFNDNLYDIDGEIINIEKGTLISTIANIFIDSNIPFIEQQTDLSITVDSIGILTENTKITVLYTKDGEPQADGDVSFYIDDTLVGEETTGSDGKAILNINLANNNFSKGNRMFKARIIEEELQSKVINVNYNEEQIEPEIYME